MIKLLTAIFEAYNQSTLGNHWYPAMDKTFCNLAVNFICNAMGYTKFNVTGIDYPVTANSMVEWMKDSPDWLVIDGNVAHAHANIGALVIAGELNLSGHGHVCAVLPGDMQLSGHFGKNAPLVMNVGKDVFIGKHAGFAFQQEPLYFVLVSSIPK